MEDIIDVYERLYDENCPVICMDEKPYQLLDHAREPRPMKPGNVTLEGNEYIRNGTCSLFVFTEPLKGWRRADALQRID